MKENAIDQLDVVDQLHDIYTGMKVCATKIFSAAKFIDYFVHDILDYTLLNKEQKNFLKNKTIFDIREAI